VARADHIAALRGVNMSATKGNGSTTQHRQPAKTLSNHAIDFIASCIRFASADAGLCVAFAVVLLQAALMALVRAL
jgi:hypothetical protein